MQPYKPQKLPLNNLDWVRFVPLIGKANAEVARFDGLLQSMQNPKVLLSPLTTQEAVLSSKIEGTQATLKEVLEFEADPNKPTKKYDDIQEIINYRKAMNFTIDSLKDIPLCARLIKDIHKILLDSVRGANKDPGNFRTIQNWIGIQGTPIEQASYIPPAPQEIGENISNLEKYMNYDDKDYLVQLAIVHVQFEMIHPFLDGNGRIGRILLPLFLYYKKVLSSPMLYLSAYFETHREEYYSKLNAVSRENKWEDWIIYFLTAVLEQSRINIDKAKAMHNLYEIKKDKIVGLTHSQYAIKSLDFIFKFPIFKGSDFVVIAKIPRATANRILKQLVDGKVLSIIEKGKGKAGNVYMFNKLLDIVA